jgi:deoxyribonuclease V
LSFEEPIPGQKRARQIHTWDLSPKEAIQLQEDLRTRVVVNPLVDASIHHVAGVDVGFPHGKEVARAAIAVLAYPSMQLVDQALAELPISFPYIPGLLSFREIPVILSAVDKIKIVPDLLIVDGHGVAHPRRFGLACHLGVLLGIPTIGCGKSILVGKHGNLGDDRGCFTDLIDDGEVIGMVLRTRVRVKPVYISVGHRTDLTSAVQLILKCGGGFRLPEPIRWAHRLASQK